MEAGSFKNATMMVEPEPRATDRQISIFAPEPEGGIAGLVQPLASLAAQLCATPVSVLFSAAGGRVFPISGLPFGVEDELRSLSSACLDDDLVVESDLGPDPRRGSPSHDTQSVQFFAGAPVRARTGRSFGTLCVADTVPRPGGLTPSQATGLQLLAGEIAEKIEFRRRLDDETQRARFQGRMLESATDHAIVALDLAGRVTRWNEGAFRLFGWSEAEMLGEHVERLFTPEDRLAGLPASELAKAIDIGRSAGERWHVGRGGERIWTGFNLTPLRSESGETEGYLQILADRSSQHTAMGALEESERRYRLAARASNDAVWDWDLRSDHLLWNEAVQTLFGYRSNEVGASGAWWKSCIHPADRDRVHASIHAVIDGTGETWTDEYRFLRADGSYAKILDRGFVLRDECGRALRMVGAMLDVTERTLSEERRQLLTRELQHRVKNTLALVQAIADQTFRGAADLRAAREAFGARLVALAQAHDLLTSTSWSAAPIREVVDGALRAHRHGGVSRIRVSGPDLLLAAKPALSLSLAIHELATNAVKYGALSTIEGFVELRWQVVDLAGEQRFFFSWEELGGPLLVGPPTRKGFGLRLIERSFSSDVQGQVTFSFDESGLSCRLQAALTSITEKDAG